MKPETFIPSAQLNAIKGGYRSIHRRILDRLQARIAAMPNPMEIAEDPGEVPIGLHYHSGETEIWVYALEDDGYAEAFVCLNGDKTNSECGPVFLPEIVAMPAMRLDLGDSGATLKDVMDGACF